MSRFLTDAQWQLLCLLCFLAGMRQKKIFDDLFESSSSSNDIDEICELISDEFLMHGLKEDFEPNNYGLELELLLDAVNRCRAHIF